MRSSRPAVGRNRAAKDVEDGPSHVPIFGGGGFLLLLALCYYLRMRRKAYLRRKQRVREKALGLPSKVSPLKRPKYSAAARNGGGGLYPDWYKGPRSAGRWEGGSA